MFKFLGKNFQKLIRKSTHIQQESLNKVSLVILIFVDIFVLINVFTGLGSVADWPLSPVEQFPCYNDYQSYQTNPDKGKLFFDSQLISSIIVNEYEFSGTPTPSNLDNPENRLGKPNSLCDGHLPLKKQVRNPAAIALNKEIDNLNNKISQDNQEIRTLQSQYDSTLLEKIAGQDPKKSINKTTAEQVKSKIETYQQQIQENKDKLIAKQTELIQEPNAAAYLQHLSDTAAYAQIKESYKNAEFWYPNQQFFLQTLFLLPLILLTYWWHSFSVEKNHGLQSLLSWHLLLLFCIPLIIKVFEFIQFGNLVHVVLDIFVTLFNGLRFIANYLLIVVIPALGFGAMKFLQTFVFNPRVQARKRIQKERCIQCNSRLRSGDQYCSFCGFEQYIECNQCHQKAFKYTNFCRSCGRNPLSDRLVPEEN